MLVKKGTKLNHSNSRAEFVPTDAAIKSARAVFQMKLSTSETKVCSVLLFFPVLLLLPRFYHIFNLNLVSLDKLYVWTSVVSYRWLRFNWRGSSMIASNILLNITETLRTSKGVSNKAAVSFPTAYCGNDSDLWKSLQSFLRLQKISSAPRNRVENKNTLDLRILGIASVCNTFGHDTDCSHTSVSVFPFLFGQTNPQE
jgi:hypothetical protein